MTLADLQDSVCGTGLCIRTNYVHCSLVLAEHYQTIWGVGGATSTVLFLFLRSIAPTALMDTCME